jgi:hypothetical protein
MTGFIFQQIKRKSINRIGIGIFWLSLSILMAYFLTIYAFANVQGSNWIGVLILYLIILFMLLVGIYEIAYGIKCLTNPAKHDAFKIFKQFDGDVTNEIERELADGKKYFPKTIFTRNWLFKNTLSDFVPVFIPDICWVYEKKVTSTLNVLITIGRDYYAMVYTSKGQEIEIPLRSKEVRAFLELLQLQNKEVRIGYSDEHKNWWANEKVLILGKEKSNVLLLKTKKPPLLSNK